MKNGPRRVLDLSAIIILKWERAYKERRREEDDNSIGKPNKPCL